MAKSLLIEVSIPEGETGWTVDITFMKSENLSPQLRQTIIKRTSREKVICIPEPGNDNFVVSVVEETTS